MNTDWRALCAELVDDYWPCHYQSELLDRARTALAQPDPISELVSQCRPLEPEMAEYLTPQARWRLYGDEAQPEPVAPTVMEILALSDEIEAEELGTIDLVRRALARWGRPTIQPELEGTNNTSQEN